MLPKNLYKKLLIGIVLFTFFVLLKPVYSQTCTSCPDDACPINCGETLIDRSTDTEEYFYFSLTSPEDVSIVMTPSSTVNYDLYVRWLADDCPPTWDCRPLLGVGIQEMCSMSELPPGTYYLMIKRNSGLGIYNLSLSCGYTTTTTTIGGTTTTTSGETTTTSIEGTTTTITGETTTTTTAGVTTTSTSTTTSTTIISLNCENDEIYVKQKNKCNVTGCEKGYWLITNYDKEPLVEEKIENIPPNEIEFGPTREVGEVFTSVICLDPYITKNTITKIVKGPILICPESCQVDDDCECEVNECKDGLFLLDNYEEEPLESEVIEDLSDVSFSYVFQPQAEGIVKARMICHDPYETIQEVIVNTTQPVTTTTLPEKFEMKTLTCNKGGCGFSVSQNTMNKATEIFVQLIKEPQGKIYYSGTLNLNPESLGSKSVDLKELVSCAPGTKLKVLTLAYSESNLNDRLYRLKGEAFTC